MTRCSSEAGVTLIETLIAMLVLLVGALGLAAAFLYGVDTATSAPNELIATQKAAEAMESVFSARDSLTVAWDDFQNEADGGIFLDGAQDMHLAGVDGIVNTEDDLAEPIESVELPGPDQNLALTADNQTVELTGFTREIQITQPDEDQPLLRQVTVVITYQAGTAQRTYTLIAFISAFA
jgi:type II secretory pathway pseudopilin PulG